MRAVITLGLVAVLYSAGCGNRSAQALAARTPPDKAVLPAPSGNKDKPMSASKRTVRRYMDAFGKSNHAEVLSCLADDVEWVIPGVFHVRGKDAFDKQIENDAFVGSPTITVTRMVEEGDVVVAEGTVRSARRDGNFLNAVFCDVFEMQEAKIKRLTSYLMEVNE